MPGRPNRRPRQPGALARLSRGRTEKILSECRLTPLEVMIANMRFYHEESALLAADLTGLMRDRGAEPMQLLEVYRKFLAARMSAQACAVDAAPYVHPRLSVMKIGGSRDPKEMADLELIENLASVSELLADEPEFAEAAE